jgi:hypothetical protein
MVAQATKIYQTTLEVPEQKRTSTSLDPSPAVKKVCIQGSRHRGQPRPQIGTRDHHLPQGQH